MVYNDIMIIYNDIPGIIIMINDNDIMYTGIMDTVVIFK